MALLYWLPLTKDLSQNGIAGESITNHGSVINASGKLGSCYEFGSSKWAECPGAAMKTITECSYSLWIKMGTLSAYNMYIFASTGSTTWQAYIFALTRPYNDSSTRKLGLTISNGSTATTAQYVTNTVFELNTWYHVAATYKAGEIKLYVNGELDATYATTIVPKFSSISQLSLGAGPSGSYTSQSFMNDIRIYDECLSAKQIKELSKGLILHYQLSDNNNTFKSNNLPIDYQEVEYILSSGALYINTNVDLNIYPTTLSAEIMWINDDGNAEKDFWGTYNSDSGGTSLITVCGKYLSNMWYCWGGSAWRPTDFGTILKDFKYYTSFSYNSATQGRSITINNQTLTLSTLTNNSIAANPNKKIGLFSGAANRLYCAPAIRLYHASIIQNFLCIRNFVPCLRKSDNKPGLYDTINNVFYTNLGTGIDFSSGPLIKNLPKEYGALDYIASQNNAYINTGVNPSGDTRLVMDCLNTAYNSPTAIFGSRAGTTSNNFNLWLQENLFGALYYNNDWTANQKTIALGTNFLHIDFNKNICTINNVSATFTKLTFNSTYPIYLLGLNNGGSIDSRMAYAKLYKCQIWNNDILLRDMHPALRLSDNKPGMYDLVNDVFYTSASSTDFTYGMETSNIIYDTSGYLHNGILLDKKLLKYEYSPRYLSCAKFYDSPIACTIPSYESNIWSISLWCYRITAISGYEVLFCFNKGSGADADKKITLAPRSGYIWLKADNSTSQYNYTIPTNEWIHLCYVSNGSTVIVYKNGVSVHTFNTSTALSDCHSLMIGGRSNNTTNTAYAVPWNGCISDVRWYATALSNIDVLELYNTSMIVDSNGNILPRVLTS